MRRNRNHEREKRHDTRYFRQTIPIQYLYLAPAQWVVKGMKRREGGGNSRSLRHQSCGILRQHQRQIPAFFAARSNSTFKNLNLGNNRPRHTYPVGNHTNIVYYRGMNAPTDNQATTLRIAIDAMMRRFKIAESEVSDSKPLNQIDIQVMLYVSAHPGCGPTDVARYLKVAPTTISSATDRLANREFLQRERPDKNRRSIALSLTGSGTRYVFDLIDVQKTHCRMMLEQLSPTDQDVFIKLISKIAQTES
ncbi:MAG: hypothetical protein COA52_20520 [Hyphomicrobiales bacterium]|nr:MAG: hypothetical protein COA52_20520 [Hyphomicrobiales bacterium]